MLSNSTVKFLIEIFRKPTKSVISKYHRMMSMDITKKFDILFRLVGISSLGMGIYFLFIFQTLPLLGVFISASGISIALFGYSKRPKIEQDAKLKIGRIIIWIGAAVMYELPMKGKAALKLDKKNIEIF